MKFIEIEPNDVPRRGKWTALINEFLASGLAAAKVADCPDKTTVVRSGCLNAIKRLDAPVSACVRNGELYLVRTDDV